MSLRVLLISIALLATGCANYRIQVPEPNPAGQPHADTLYVYGWGAIESASPKIAEECDITNALDSVRVRTNFGYDLISVVTLGFFRPIDIEYKCSAGPSILGTTAVD